MLPEISIDDPIGFIATRQSFAKKNKTGSDVLNLKTITSDLVITIVNLAFINFILKFELD